MRSWSGGDRRRARRGWRGRRAFGLEPAAQVFFLVLAVVLFLVLYLFALPIGSCGSRSHWSCVLNNNGGLLGAYGLFLAVLGLVLTVLPRSFDHRSIRIRFDYWLEQAVYEACHNLRHIAEAFDGDRLTTFPHYTMRITAELTNEPLELYLRKEERGQVLWDHIDHMMRNDEILRGLSQDQLEIAEPYTKYLVEHMLTFIFDATRLYPQARAVLRQCSTPTGSRPLAELADGIARDPDRRFLPRFATSRLLKSWRKRKAAYGTAEPCFVCWVDDSPDAAAALPTPPREVGPLFAGLDDPPRAPLPRPGG